MIDSVAFKTCSLIRSSCCRRDSHSSQSPHIARVHELLRRPSCRLVPSTMHHHARSQISEVQFKLSSGRGSRGQARTAFAAERPTQCFNVVGAVVFKETTDSVSTVAGLCPLPQELSSRSLIIKVVQLDSMIQRPCARFGGPLPYPMGPLGHLKW